ncbi:MAG: hypothetical protein OJF51_004106 [Nitrospira sp.]|jgi:hypothetical protein|nr:MAG: hypothetical protein OJF51_004106 [Nitrospira sp.]
MSVYVFAGPTIRPERARSELTATYLPPVSQGDVYRVAAFKPFAIGIIDGYFDRVPAVWHKEILWAMAQGIHVFGAASMGALRAAELDAFGMKGVGKIYEAFRDGELEDDDEVAVTHSKDYVPSSDAMVNIRYTLEKAERQSIIRSTTRSTLERIAKQLFYPERTYHAVLARGRAEGLPTKDLANLEHWLPKGRVDQKLQDAIAMLRSIRRLTANKPHPKEVDYAFEHTYMWEQLTHEAGELRMETASPESILTWSVLEELRLDGPSYTRATDDCLLRLLLHEKLFLNDEKSTDIAILKTTVAFRESRKLFSASDIRRWLKDQSLKKQEFLQYMHEEEKLEKVRARLREGAERLLPRYLKLSGQYRDLAKRAAHKRQVLSELGLENPTEQDVGMDDTALLEWYFHSRLTQLPLNDPDFYAKAQGFQDKNDFLEAVRRERCYVMHHTKRMTTTKGITRPNRTVA